MSEDSSETLESVCKRGRDLLHSRDRAVRMHTNFERWDRQVAAWLDDNFPNSGLSAQWSSLVSSSLLVGNTFYEDSVSLNQYREAVQARLAWLGKMMPTKVTHRLPVIRLTHKTWRYDPEQQLGPTGGFGAVYLGYSDDDTAVAIKKLKIDADDSAHRELRIAAELSGNPMEHVIPVFDSGQDADSSTYFVVMAKADHSLQDAIKRGFALLDVPSALLQIAKGLGEASSFVHRDLKPGNVLCHEGKWKIADFGIARFVDETTSIRTLKHGGTPAYAAPEQWKGERATNATDVYALGCIAYTLICGHPPFSDDHREQHLHASPPSLECDRRLSALVLQMLRKNQSMRPGIDRVVSVLTGIDKEPSIADSDGRSEIAAAGEATARREAESLAKQQQLLTTKTDRGQLASAAYSQLRSIADGLCEAIVSSTPAATKVVRPGEIVSFQVSLGAAELTIEMELAHVHPLGEFNQSKWDVIASGTIGVAQGSPNYEWWASLWYGTLGPKDPAYRWREVAYYSSPLVRAEQGFEPFQLTAEPSKADEAAGPALGVIEVAYGPKLVDDEDEPAFQVRWMKRLACASIGELCRPRQMPIRD